MVILRGCAFVLFLGVIYMIKKLFMGIIYFLLFSKMVLADVVINQVLYDPVSESTGEAVELYNNGGSGVDISRWMLKTGASEQDAVLPANTVLQPEQYHLISDAGWNTTKEAGWRGADLETTINLYNSNSGVALMDFDFNIMDAVGWGNVNDSGLYEGGPAMPVSQGNVLKRIKDSNNNSADFIEATADFSEKVSTNQLILEVNVISPLDFGVTIIPDDSLLAGFQVMPIPGSDKKMIVTANTTNTNLTLFAGFLNTTKQMTSNEAGYLAEFDIPFYTPPGSYNTTIAFNNFERQQQVEILGVSALDIDSDMVIFEDASPGKEVYVYGDKSMETKNKPTIRNIGNTVLDINLFGTDLVSGMEKIGVRNVMFSFNNLFDYGLSDLLGYASLFLDLGLEPAATSEFGFKLSVPLNATGGKYIGKVSVVGVGSG